MDLSKEERIMVTGGAGFLGKHLQQELLKRGVPRENLLVPCREDYDLTKEDNVIRMYDDMNPTVVIHLAAEVGGIGANRENPGRFFYANTAMGLHLIEYARLYGIKKFVQIGTVCAYPKFTPVPFKEENLWNGYPEETNAPYGIAKKALLVMLQSYRQQYGLSGIYLLPVNLYGPGDNFDLNSSHVIPALIRKFCGAVDTGANQVVVWGTYLGDSGDNWVNTHNLAIDGQGNAYVSVTSNSGFPTTAGAFQTVYGGGNSDIAISKFDWATGALIASTFLGGSGGDNPDGIYVDASGNVFITGETGSTDFPVTSGTAYQSQNGGSHDAVVVMLSADFSQLLYSTYMGGGSYDMGRSGFLDHNGNLYITG